MKTDANPSNNVKRGGPVPLMVPVHWCPQLGSALANAILVPAGEPSVLTPKTLNLELDMIAESIECMFPLQEIET